MTPYQQKLKTIIDGLNAKTLDGSVQWRLLATA